MDKTIKTLFTIFNIVLLSCNYIFVAWFPTNLVFGWIPFQLLFFYVSMLAAAIVWGAYYKWFFNKQKHVDEKYGEE